MGSKRVNANPTLLIGVHLGGKLKSRCGPHFPTLITASRSVRFTWPLTLTFHFFQRSLFFFFFFYFHSLSHELLLLSCCKFTYSVFYKKINKKSLIGLLTRHCTLTGFLQSFFFTPLFFFSSNRKQALAFSLSFFYLLFSSLSTSYLFPNIMNDPDNPDLSNDSAWRELSQLSAQDSDFFDRDTSNILSDLGWNLHASSDHHHSLRFDSDLTPTAGVRSPVTNLHSTSSCSSSAAAASVAVTEVSTSNNPSATSSSSEDPAENSTASAVKTPETPWVLFSP